MGNVILDTLRGFIADYGYWAVAVALLCENAGLPVPGETTLLLASFLAYSEQRLHLGWIILVGTVAATLGDNIGYAIGYHGGRALLNRYQHIFRIPKSTIARGENLFQRFGAATIFFARFIFGMRVIAGPLAGVLRMSWNLFVIFNLLGAVAWVTVIALAGYFFGRNWARLSEILGRFDIAVAALVCVAAAVWWWRRRRKRAE